MKNFLPISADFKQTGKIKYSLTVCIIWFLYCDAECWWYKTSFSSSSGLYNSLRVFAAIAPSIPLVCSTMGSRKFIFTLRQLFCRPGPVLTEMNSSCFFLNFFSRFWTYKYLYIHHSCPSYIAIARYNSRTVQTVQQQRSVCTSSRSKLKLAYYYKPSAGLCYTYVHICIHIFTDNSTTRKQQYIVTRYI